MSYGYRTEFQEILNELLNQRQTFGATEVVAAIKFMHEESGQYHDPVEIKKIKSELMSLFEKGQMPGYCVRPLPYVDDNGVGWELKFEPFNPMDPLDLILPPENEEGDAKCIASCHLHLEFAELVQKLAERADCTEDTMIRSILIRGLQLIYDEMD